ncbi:hypothetical protein ENBRE01_2557 [Enteropsectra breve]|nr:hypothetical protein ENBRE01_2557 [Enteropsectra breve]
MAYRIKKYKKHGTSSRTAGFGRLSLLLTDEKVKVLVYLKSHPRESAANIQSYIQRKTGKRVCVQTIKKILNAAGING